MVTSSEVISSAVKSTGGAGGAAEDNYHKSLVALELINTENN